MYLRLLLLFSHTRQEQLVRDPPLYCQPLPVNLREVEDFLPNHFLDDSRVLLDSYELAFLGAYAEIRSTFISEIQISTFTVV